MCANKHSPPPPTPQMQNHHGAVERDLNNQLAVKESALSDLKSKLLKEVEMRRQQLTEISLARERERREWMEQEKQRLIEQDKMAKEQLQKLAQQHSEELHTLVGLFSVVYTAV